MENKQEDFSPKEATNETLCNIIVSHRYTGLFEERALQCYIELAARREGGDSYPFEDKIEEELGKLPKFKLDINKIFSNGYNISDIFNIVK